MRPKQGPPSFWKPTYGICWGHQGLDLRGSLGPSSGSRGPSLIPHLRFFPPPWRMTGGKADRKSTAKTADSGIGSMVWGLNDGKTTCQGPLRLEYCGSFIALNLGMNGPWPEEDLSLSLRGVNSFVGLVKNVSVGSKTLSSSHQGTKGSNFILRTK